MESLVFKRLAAIALTLCTLSVGVVASADTVVREFKVVSGGTFDLDTDIGSIDVATDAADTLRVEVERAGRDGELLELAFDDSGDGVRVRAQWPRVSDDDYHSRKARVKFRVHVPRRFNLTLATRGGSISVGDLEGTLEARTSGGALDFGHIHGPVTAHTSGGSIALAGAGADVKVKTSGGSIKVGNVEGSLRAHTSGGSVRLAGATGRIEATTSGGSVEATLATQPSEDCVLSTSGGSVTLYMAEHLAVDIDASSSGGGVRSDFALDGRSKARRHLRGSINGGGPTVRLQSSGGGVRIRKAH